MTIAYAFWKKKINVSHVSPISENSNLDHASKYFTCGWKKLPGHGKSKGNSCMKSTCKDMIYKYVYEG